MGAFPFVSTVAAAAVIVFLHRAVALLSIRWRWFEDLVTGREIDLVHHGQIDRVAMRHALVTDRNLQEAVRQSPVTRRLRMFSAPFWKEMES
ncbi:uncharacterized membrane protein YcaP (DUF421 family) [Variovorax sp. GrIS 2.14]|uniref:hypothetical protein n=1 Tax=Variovorax sp. GrIS 2.14 TaxID=3071709 RepID=UPI0038F6AE20